MLNEDKTVTLNARERWEIVAISSARIRKLVEDLQFAKPAVAKDLANELSFWNLLRSKVI